MELQDPACVDFGRSLVGSGVDNSGKFDSCAYCYPSGFAIFDSPASFLIDEQK